MARIGWVSGGCRSGKSDFALRRVLEFSKKSGAQAVFLATYPRSTDVDHEMDQRILSHQKSRDPELWKTIEEPLNLQSRIHQLAQVSKPWAVVVDCVSLWVSNLLFQNQGSNGAFGEAQIAEECQKVLDECQKLQGLICFVSSEVGLGIVPESSLGRVYRDLLGRANQVIAAQSDEAFFLVSGLPLQLKSSPLSGRTLE
ncbi:MAG: bifunctional adenosylcobinamide kinase/adenosylcobinamide-phosphate guanylyltransferase [Bdellovibrionia bacterium]